MKTIAGKTEKVDINDPRALVLIEQKINKGKFIVLNVDGMKLKQQCKLVEDIDDLCKKYQHPQTPEMAQDLRGDIERVEIFTSFKKLYEEELDPRGFQKYGPQVALSKQGQGSWQQIKGRKLYTCVNRTNTRK